MELIREHTLRELVRADALSEMKLVGQPGGYCVSVGYGAVERVLSNTRGEVRLFTLQSATRFLSELGIKQFYVDTSEYRPGRIRAPRPDRSEALKKTRTRLRQATLV